MGQLYDEIGIGYGVQRRPDPRISAQIADALGDAGSVLNVGAGAGSYEPTDRAVTAVEISRRMIRQRPAGAAAVIQASALELPFASGAFDATLASLTLHHWADRPRGLRELARVSRQRVVIFTFEPEAKHFWLVDDYFPEIAEMDRRILPGMDEIRDALGEFDVLPVPVPHDCADGFLGAFWRRPEAYLDAQVRRSISSFAVLPDLDRGLARLRADLEDGTWERRHGHLRAITELDIGYRLVVSTRTRA